MLPAIRTWHAKCPEAIAPMLQDALTTRLFLVHESGPLKFTLRDADGATFHVLLGPRHQCSCSPPVLVARGSPGTMAKPASLPSTSCIHVIWSLHRRLRISAASPLLYQTGILDHEWNQLPSARRGNSASAKGSTGTGKGKGKKKTGGGGVPQRPVTEDDVCPICQESVFESEIPLCFCRQSCGNSIHVPCMKLVADHQAKALGQTTVTCPLCRADFGSMDDIEMLAQEWSKAKRQVNLVQSRRARLVAPSRVTAGPACRGCKKPVRGTRYKCTVCTAVHLCQPCFDDSDVHREHPFKCKAPDADNWTFAARYLPDAPTSATIDELQSRDLSDADYVLLTSLDAGKRIVGYPRLHVINTFPLKKVPATASVGTVPCVICTDALVSGARLRQLPCGHARFHQECVDRWLIHGGLHCPHCSTQVICCIDAATSQYIPAVDVQSPEPDAFTTLLDAADRKQKRAVQERRKLRRPKVTGAASSAAKVQSSELASLPPLFDSLMVVSAVRSLPSRSSPTQKHDDMPFPAQQGRRKAGGSRSRAAALHGPGQTIMPADTLDFGLVGSRLTI